MDYLYLKELGYSDWHRTVPLAKMGAEIRNIHSDRWRPVRGWRIEGLCFNELSGTWLDWNEWRCPSGITLVSPRSGFYIDRKNTEFHR